MNEWQEKTISLIFSLDSYDNLDEEMVQEKSMFLSLTRKIREIGLQYVSEKTCNEYLEFENGIFHPIICDKNLEAQESIQLDFQVEKLDSINFYFIKKEEIFTKNSQNTIYLSHGPPYDTYLDLTSRNEHVGIISLKTFIQQYNPRLVLCGHIHETVEMTGKTNKIK